MKKFLVAAALTSVAVAASAQGNSIAGWNIHVDTDAMTDKKQAAAVVEAANDAFFAVKCDEAGPDSVYLHVNGNKYLGSDFDRYEMMVRFDSDQPITLRMAVKGRNAIVTENSVVRSLSRKIASAQKMAFRLRSYDHSTYDVVFDLTNSSEAVERVFRECRDTY